MILFDTNIVLALFARKHPHHELARPWFDALRMARETFGVPITVWHSFVRLATNRVATNPPARLADAFEFSERMRAHSGYRPVDPGTRHLEIFREVCLSVQARGNIVPDAVIAAIAIENGAAVASFDRDFARFPALRWVNPADQPQ